MGTNYYCFKFIIGAIAAMRSARSASKSSALAEKQLIEMKEQRIDSQKPALFIKDVDNIESVFDYQGKDESDMVLNINPSETFYSRGSGIKLPVVNIGNGPAKYITAKIQFDEEYINEMFNNEKIRKELNMDLTFDEKGNKVIELGIKDNFKMFIFEDREDLVRIPFIESGKQNYIRLPDNHIQFLNLCIIKKVFFEMGRIPKISIILNYYDSIDSRKTYEDLTYFSPFNVLITASPITYSLMSDMYIK